MRITIVAANSIEYDSRLRRTAMALAGDGHAVTILGFAGPGLAEREFLPEAEAVLVRRLPLDRRISGAFQPLPGPLRSALVRLLGIDPDATVLAPSTGSGFGTRVLGPLRRLVEILAVVRRTGPWTTLVLDAAADTDVFQAKALIALPVVRGAARRTGARFVYDVADLHTEAARLARMPNWFRRLVRGREAGWVREAAAVTAVSDGVAGEAQRRFGLAVRPTVVRNCPPAWHPGEALPGDRSRPGDPMPDRLRTKAGLPPERAVVLFQGGFSVDRGIEELVAALDEPPLRGRDVAAVFLGYGRLREWLLEAAERRPGRVVVLDAVPPGELLEWTASADVGYVGQPPRTLNQRLNLSNKLFESLMAGVPVLVAEETEHCRLVADEGVGACADVDRPVEIAAALERLLGLEPAELEALRLRCRTAALERYSWEVQQAGLVERFRALEGGARAPRADSSAPRAGAGAPKAGSSAPAPGSNARASGSKPRIALLLNNPFVTDSRAWKLAGSLAGRGFSITVVARPADGLPERETRDGVEIVRVAQPAPRWLPAPGLPGGDEADVPAGAIPQLGRVVRESVGRVAQAARFLWLTRSWASAIQAVVSDADVWQAEGLISLPVALELRRRRGGRVIYDSRDLHVESARFARLPGPWRRLLRWRERSWVRAADGLITVSQPYADVLERTLGRRATIVMNGPLLASTPATRDRRLSERLGLAPEAPIVLSLGQVAPGRGIGTLLAAAERLAQVHVVVAGFGPSYDGLRERAAAGPAADRIHFLPGVAPDAIAAVTAAADVVAIPVLPTTLNHRLNTPTKLFDAMGVGTPVVASDLPGLAGIVRSTGCGELFEAGDADDLARVIRVVLEAPAERRAGYGEAGRRAVRERFAWELQVEALIGVYAELGIPVGGIRTGGL